MSIEKIKGEGEGEIIREVIYRIKNELRRLNKDIKIDSTNLEDSLVRNKDAYLTVKKIICMVDDVRVSEDEFGDKVSSGYGVVYVCEVCDNKKAIVLNISKDNNPDNIKEMKKIIYEAVKSVRHRSFVELERICQKNGYKTKGATAMFQEALGETILWRGSGEFITAVMELDKEKKIFFHPTGPLLYAADGELLNFPIARRAIKYKTTHWLPVTICTFPAIPDAK